MISADVINRHLDYGGSKVDPIRSGQGLTGFINTSGFLHSGEHILLIVNPVYNEYMTTIEIIFSLHQPLIPSHLQHLQRPIVLRHHKTILIADLYGSDVFYFAVQLDVPYRANRKLTILTNR